jgi:hypothetical protein
MSGDQTDSIQLLNDRYSVVQRALYSATNRLLVNELLVARELLDGAIAYVKHPAHVKLVPMSETLSLG